MDGLGVVYEQDDGALPPHDAPTSTDVPDESEQDEDLRALNPDAPDVPTTNANSAHQTEPPAVTTPDHYTGAGYEVNGYHHEHNDHGNAGNGSGHHGRGPASSPSVAQAGKLFIGGVSWETTEEGLRAHFGKYGALTDAALMKDKYTGQPRGFGFVTFADASVISQVLEEAHVIDGRTVEVKRAIPREKVGGAPSDSRGGGFMRGGSGGGGSGSAGFIETRKIFVGGLAPSVAEQDFRQYFEEFGKILDAVVMIDRDTQRSRGFGFVTFEDESAVAEVLSKSHEIHGKTVEIKRAEPKEMRPGGSSSGGYGGGGYGSRSGYGGGRSSGGYGSGSGGGGSGGGGTSGGYGAWRGYGGYGGAPYGGYGGGGYGGGGRGAGYAAGAYGGYGGYGGYAAAYGGYAGYGYGGAGRGGYAGYGAYPGYPGYGAAAQGGEEGGEGAPGGAVAGGEEGYGEDASSAAQAGAAGGYSQGYDANGAYVFGGGAGRGGSGAPGSSRSDRYRPY